MWLSPKFYHKYIIIYNGYKDKRGEGNTGTDREWGSCGGGPVSALKPGRRLHKYSQQTYVLSHTIS